MIGFFKKIRDAHGDNSKVEHQDNDLGTTQDIVKKSNLISLLLMLEPLSEPVRRIEEYYEKLDVPQKKYCYIERS